MDQRHIHKLDILFIIFNCTNMLLYMSFLFSDPYIINLFTFTVSYSDRLIGSSNFS